MVLLIFDLCPFFSGGGGGVGWGGWWGLWGGGVLGEVFFKRFTYFVVIWFAGLKAVH